MALKIAFTAESGEEAIAYLKKSSNRSFNNRHTNGRNVGIGIDSRGKGISTPFKKYCANRLSRVWFHQTRIAIGN